MLANARQAQNLDSNLYSESGDGCEHPFPAIELPNRTMSESESQLLRVHLSNMGNGECVIDVTLIAPNFDLGAVEATRRISVPPGSKTSQLIWVISPKKSGTFKIVAQSGLDTDIIGVTVLNVFGFSPWQAQLFSFASTVFGPMLTIPWWYEKLKGQKKKR